MKRLDLYLSVVVALVVALGAGCGTIPTDLAKNKQLAQAYREYRAIDTKNLTPTQRVVLARLEDNEFTEFDFSLMAGYPWIDPENLSVRDKLFLADQANAVMGAIYWSNSR